MESSPTSDTLTLRFYGGLEQAEAWIRAVSSRVLQKVLQIHSPNREGRGLPLVKGLPRGGGTQGEECQTLSAHPKRWRGW